MTFFLGVHKPHWLRTLGVPLFVSARRLRGYATPPQAIAPWALDSGGFSELSMHGRWTVDAMAYSSEVRRWSKECGNLQWAAAQDWMCEPFILAKTGMSVRAHQDLTVRNYLLLRQLAPDLPWVPVIQGFRHDEYMDHVEQYAAAGVDLAALPLVGVGSICRRQATGEAEEIFASLHSLGIRLHAFGLKLQGLRRSAQYLASSDSMAWSFDARRSAPLPCCSHKSCANCHLYAMRWREKALRACDSPASQRLLFSEVE